MKQKMLSDIFTKNNLIIRIAALLMSAMFLFIAGCQSGEGKDKDTQSATSSPTSSVTDTSSDDASSTESEVSSENNSQINSQSSSTTSTRKDPAKGNIAIEEDFKYTTVPSDDDEYKLLVNPAGLAYNYKGYAGKEADALRNEILNTKNTEEYYDIKGTKYYISANGNDNNDGLSPKTPIKSIATIDMFDLKPGDAVLFERGSIFRLLEQYNPSQGVIYGSYGTGRKPIILGSPENFANCLWKPSNKKNVWYTSYLYAYPCGMFFNQGEEIGYMKYSLRAMTKNTDFWNDTDSSKLYVYCDRGNPADVWDSIEIPQTGAFFKILAGVSNLTFDNLCMRYTDSGINGSYNNHFLTGTNLEIGYTGGAQFQSGNRYGNAFSHWYGGEAFTINHSWIYQTFDSAVSPQGNGGPHLKYDNMSICNNLFEYNNADIEFWDHGNEWENGKENIEYSRFVNFKMDGNICRFTSLGWGTRADDGGLRGIEGVIYGMAEGNLLKNVTFTNNIVDCPGRKIFDFHFNTVEQANGFIRKNNTIYIKNSLRATDHILRGITLPFDGVLSHFSNKKEGVKDLLHKFDPTAKVYWYE